MSGFDYAQQERRIASLESNRGASLRFGTVTGVDTATGTARVQLPDGDGMVTMPLRVLGRRTLKDKAQALPDIGEPVACLFSGQGLEQGVILGAHYTAKTPSPNQEAQVDYVRYEDGTELWYDRKGHKLTAKVMGDADIETEGGITATAKKAIVTESKTGITLRAPHIRLEGNLSQQGYAGGAASSILCGNQTICNGSLSVPGGDVSAGDVSLRGHQHEGVESGPATSGKPEGGGSSGTTDDNESGFWEALFDVVRESLPEQLSPMEELLLCLPDIAEAEAGRQKSAPNKQGWLYLRDMFRKWFSGRANENPDANPVPFRIDWDWVMQYPRAAQTYDTLRMEYSFNEKAWKKLSEILARDEKLSDQCIPFDYTQEPWTRWETVYHTGLSVPGKVWPVDGMMAALAGFTLRALAKGRVCPNGDGTYTITVTGLSIFAHDKFNFEGDAWLGFWSCKKKIYHFNPLAGDFSLSNSDFHIFRKSLGLGNDFLVLSQQHPVAPFQEQRYVFKP